MSKANAQEKKARLKRKIRAKVSGTAARPRLSVFRSNNFMYAQLIDDAAQATLAAANDVAAKKGATKMDGAKQVGADIAAKAKAQGISAVVFDRSGFKYAGRVKALADAAREAGLQL